jgi:hypothetical protein
MPILVQLHREEDLMEASSTPTSTPASARSKTKPRVVTDSQAAPAKKKGAARKKSAALPSTTVAKQSVNGESGQPPPREIMIATAAYYLAEHRNFQPGYELDDWLTAERQISGWLSEANPSAPAPV